MKILFLGDVMGRAGRAAVASALPGLRAEFALDFVVVNAENASSGVGLTGDHARILLDAGADCLTLGDHAFDQKDMLTFIEKEPRILRPLNLGKGAPGRGARLFEAGRGKRVFIAQALGQVFMKQPYADPFAALESALREAPLGARADAVIVDFHAEATSEKMAMAHVLNGRASLVAGTHTHVPTADLRILSGGTAAVSDLGMCGDYDSVIGMEKEEPLRRFLTGLARDRFTPARGEVTLSGVILETGRDGRAASVTAFRRGGLLAP
jgi:metallophosphoesterase (TIGR00282 family)